MFRNGSNTASSTSLVVKWKLVHEEKKRRRIADARNPFAMSSCTERFGVCRFGLVLPCAAMCHFTRTGEHYQIHKCCKFSSGIYANIHVHPMNSSTLTSAYAQVRYNVGRSEYTSSRDSIGMCAFQRLFVTSHLTVVQIGVRRPKNTDSHLKRGNLSPTTLGDRRRRTCFI